MSNAHGAAVGFSDPHGSAVGVDMSLAKQSFWKSIGIIAAEIFLAVITIGAIIAMLLPVYFSLPK